MLRTEQDKPRRHFTQAARDAALARRREIAALPKSPSGRLQVFVVRGSKPGNSYAWEVRRFGAVVVARSTYSFFDHAAAREAGEAALRCMTAP